MNHLSLLDYFVLFVIAVFSLIVLGMYFWPSPTDFWGGDDPGEERPRPLVPTPLEDARAKRQAQLREQLKREGKAVDTRADYVTGACTDIRHTLLRASQTKPRRVAAR